MNAFIGVEHGFKVVPRLVFKIMTEKAILVANWAQFGHLGILFSEIGTLNHLSYCWR